MRISDIIKEAPKRQKPKSKARPVDYAEPDSTKVHFDKPTSKGELTRATVKPKTSTLSKLPGTKSKGAPHIAAPAGSAEAMRQFMNQTRDVTDEIPDTDLNMAYDDEVAVDTEIGIDPKDPETLPAVISTDLDTIGGEVALKDINLNWIEVRTLPGYAIQQIRGAFRPLFQHLTNAALEDISVAASFDPKTSLTDMKLFISWLDENGIKEDNFSLEAFNINPEEYHITQAYVYTVGDDRFLVLQESMGGMDNMYIYTAKKPEQKEITFNR